METVTTRLTSKDHSLRLDMTLPGDEISLVLCLHYFAGVNE